MKKELISDFLHGFIPNAKVSRVTKKAYIVSFLVLAAILWIAIPSKIIPSPWEIVGALPNLWHKLGLGPALFASIELNFKAVVIMSALSLTVAYATVIPALRPIALGFAAGRFNGFVGLPLLFTIIFGDPSTIKVALLVFGMSVFTVPSVVSIIEGIPRDAFDHGRVLQMSEWRVVWEVVILGKMHEVIDVLRTNIAMGWMMLPMVEGIFRNQGGIGALLLVENKYFHIDTVFCIVFLVAALGLFQDYLIKTAKYIICPYSKINMERD